MEYKYEHIYLTSSPHIGFDTSYFLSGVKRVWIQNISISQIGCLNIAKEPCLPDCLLIADRHF